MVEKNSTAEVPTVYREWFESALLAHLCNDPKGNRESLTRASQKALSEGRLDYHEFFQGELAFAGNNPRDALKHYESALNRTPDNSLFLSNKATVLVHLGKTSEAIPLFEKSLTVNPSETHALAGLITALAEIGSTKRARQLVTRLFKTPNLKSIYKFDILEALVDLDEERKALRLVDQLLGEFPNNIYCTNLRLAIESKMTARRLREFARRPYLRALLTCDSVRRENGKLNCEGVFEFLNMLTFPAIAPRFSLFVSFLSRRLYSVVNISFRDSRGKAVHKHSARAHTANLGVATQVILGVRSLSIPAPGSYSIDVHVDREKIGSTPFIVLQKEPRPDYTAEEIRKLLDDPRTIKKIKLAFDCSKCKKRYVFQMNLDAGSPLDEEALPFPEDDHFVCEECGQRIDMKAFRLQARQLLGTHRPDKQKEKIPS